jgi:hypothetical protein
MRFRLGIVMPGGSGAGRDFPVDGDELVVFQPGKSRALPGLVV